MPRRPAVQLHPRGARRARPAAASPATTGFESITARRPVVEAAVAAAAETTPGVTVRRGVAVAGLLTDGERAPGVPHVVGVAHRRRPGDPRRPRRRRRRPPLARCPPGSEAGGAPAPQEELEDCGFVYYGRHFRSADGSIPPAIGPLLQHYGIDLDPHAARRQRHVGRRRHRQRQGRRACAACKDVDAGRRSSRAYPLVAHWIDGEPLDDDVAVMAKIEDRQRRFVVDGAPVATGVVAVGDSWACTNPSLGRGTSIGMLHAVALRDHAARRTGSTTRSAFAAALATRPPSTTVEPWYRATLAFDRHRLAEIEARIEGRDVRARRPELGRSRKALERAPTGRTPTCCGRFVRRRRRCSTLPDEVLAQPGVARQGHRRSAPAGATAPMLGRPERAELVDRREVTTMRVDVDGVGIEVDDQGERSAGPAAARLARLGPRCGATRCRRSSTPASA